MLRSSIRKSSEPIIDTALMVRVLTAAFVIVIGTIVIFISEMEDGKVTAKDTTITFTLFVLFDMFNALTCRSADKSIFTIGFTTNKAFLLSVSASLLCQLLVIYVPFFQSIFQTEAISLFTLTKLICISSSIFWIDEIRKAVVIRQKFRSRKRETYRKVSALEMV